MADLKNSRKQDRPFSAMLTVSEVASIFRVNPSTVRRWSHRGIIKAHRIGPRGSLRFRREDVAVLYLDRAIRRFLKG